MKHFKFSRLFAAAAVVAMLVLVGCKQPDATAPDGIIGTWVSSYGEKYVVSEDSVSEAKWMSWVMEIEDVEEVSDSAGVIYGILTKGTKFTPEGTYYAFAYKDLTGNSVKIATGAVSYKTLEEVEEKCTIDKFSYYSECKKQ